MIDTPKLYIADLAAYNNGKLHGVWIDATEDIDCINKQIQNMLSTSPEPDAEEYAIHDYEGFGSLNISEYQSIALIQDWLCFIEEHDKLGLAVLEHFCGNIEDAHKAIENNYCGEFKSTADYAQDITEETTEIPENLSFYIDYESMARDMELNGDIYTIETGYEEVHIFWNH